MWHYQWQHVLLSRQMQHFAWLLSSAKILHVIFLFSSTTFFIPLPLSSVLCVIAAEKTKTVTPSLFWSHFSCLSLWLRCWNTAAKNTTAWSPLCSLAPGRPPEALRAAVRGPLTNELHNGRPHPRPPVNQHTHTHRLTDEQISGSAPPPPLVMLFLSL